MRVGTYGFGRLADIIQGRDHVFSITVAESVCFPGFSLKGPDFGDDQILASTTEIPDEPSNRKNFTVQNPNGFEQRISPKSCRSGPVA
jgi:hypothetical protein